MNDFIDRSLEFKILHFMCKDLSFFRRLPNDFFAHEDSIILYEWLEEHVSKYNALPTMNVIDDMEVNRSQLLFMEAHALTLSITDFSYFSKKMFDNYLDRQIYSIGSIITNGLHVTEGETLRQDILERISGIDNPFTSGGTIRRQFIYEQVRERWRKYVETEKDPDKATKAVPWGIEIMDELTMGAQPSWLVCFFALAKEGKTRFKANLAFNQAFLYKADIMWISREMSLEDMAVVFDSRLALINQTQLRRGQLGDRRTVYKNALKYLEQTTPNLYIVDMPGDCRALDIENELLMYYNKFGKFPAVCYVDYANLLEPNSRKYNDRSSKYDMVFKELHDVFRKTGVSGVTSVQESRDGAKEKDKSKIDASHIGLSHYIVPHVELMMHLYREQIDIMTHTMHCKVVAGRHTPARSFSLFAFMDVNYIGDRRIGIQE